MLYPVQYEGLIRQALQEDLGGTGDVTSQAVVPFDLQGQATIVSRESGCLAGLEVAERTFRMLDSELRVERLSADGQSVEPGQAVLRVEGRAQSILTGERTALNFLGRMCAIATATARVAARLSGTRARVVCTRKTTPCLRMLEKYAVRCGGGASHRFGLDDGILIKDNHVALAGGVREAVLRARERASHMLKLEVEVDTLEQLREVLDLPIDAVLLDNFEPERLRRAVAMVGSRVTTEASGGITIENVAEMAETGVDLISMGALTHSVKVLDLSLEMEGAAVPR